MCRIVVEWSAYADIDWVVTQYMILEGVDGVEKVFVGNALLLREVHGLV